uniref:Large ribosomal subunit protein bL32m n=1 Tax=Knipowitschia caucasica TaxID=637954 RepID=A0AAV2MBD0_KNICA
MAAPKKRRTIEVNRTRRRADSKLLKLKTNIEPCPECGHLKQKHILFRLTEDHINTRQVVDVNEDLDASKRQLTTQ